MTSKSIDVSNMGLISHSYQKLSKDDSIILRIGKEYFHARYGGCSETISSLRSLSQRASFKFVVSSRGVVMGKLSTPSKENGCRHILDTNTGRRINVFVHRVGKFDSLRPYSEWKRNKLEKSVVVSSNGEEPQETIHNSVKLEQTGIKSAVDPTKLPMNVLEVIAQCKLAGTLHELIHVAKEVQDGNRKLGITVSIDL